MMTLYPTKESRILCHVRNGTPCLNEMEDITADPNVLSHPITPPENGA